MNVTYKYIFIFFLVLVFRKGPCHAYLTITSSASRQDEVNSQWPTWISTQKTDVISDQSSGYFGPLRPLAVTPKNLSKPKLVHQGDVSISVSDGFESTTTPLITVQSNFPATTELGSVTSTPDFQANVDSSRTSTRHQRHGIGVDWKPSGSFETSEITQSDVTVTDYNINFNKSIMKHANILGSPTTMTSVKTSEGDHYGEPLIDNRSSDTLTPKVEYESKRVKSMVDQNARVLTSENTNGNRDEAPVIKQSIDRVTTSKVDYGDNDTTLKSVKRSNMFTSRVNHIKNDVPSTFNHSSNIMASGVDQKINVMTLSFDLGSNIAQPKLDYASNNFASMIKKIDQNFSGMNLTADQGRNNLKPEVDLRGNKMTSVDHHNKNILKLEVDHTSSVIDQSADVKLSEVEQASRIDRSAYALTSKGQPSIADLTPSVEHYAVLKTSLSGHTIANTVTLQDGAEPEGVQIEDESLDQGLFARMTQPPAGYPPIKEKPPPGYPPVSTAPPALPMHGSGITAYPYPVPVPPPGVSQQEWKPHPYPHGQQYPFLSPSQHVRNEAKRLVTGIRKEIGYGWKKVRKHPPFFKNGEPHFNNWGVLWGSAMKKFGSMGRGYRGYYQEQGSHKENHSSSPPPSPNKSKKPK